MSASDKITDFAISKIDSLVDTIQKTLPTISKYTLEVTKMDCISNLVFLVLPPLATLIFFFLFRMFWSWHKEETCSDWEIPAGAFFILMVISSLITVLCILNSFWYFVCISHPDIYLIHLMVQRVLGT